MALFHKRHHWIPRVSFLVFYSLNLFHQRGEKALIIHKSTSPPGIALTFSFVCSGCSLVCIFMFQQNNFHLLRTERRLLYFFFFFVCACVGVLPCTPEPTHSAPLREGVARRQQQQSRWSRSLSQLPYEGARWGLLGIHKRKKTICTYFLMHAVLLPHSV